ncbi:MAG: SPOR domain-containing protein [Pseudomonadota bacterium]
MANEEADIEEDEEYEEYEEYDDEDEEDDEGGLSGLVVLLMGVVMLGAFASVVWIAYQQGAKNGPSSTPVVAADPEPVKIETSDAGAAVNDREVYDNLEGRETQPVEVLVDASEEPVSREVDDAIGAIAAAVEGASDDVSEAADVVDDAVADRIAALEAADAALEEAPGEALDAVEDAADDVVDAVAETAPAAIDPEPQSVVETPAVPDPVAASDALSGTHVVQVGAFRSEDEAVAFWNRLSGRVGDYLDGKARHVERADLGDRGVYYRLRIGPFASSSAASTYCSGLKERGQDCLTRAN